MVYCTRCGTQNAEDSAHCSNCGSPLHSETYKDRQYYRNEFRKYHEEEYHPKTGSSVGLLIAGVFILIIGIALFFNQINLIFEYFWSIVLVIIGIWLLLRGLRWSQQKSKHPQS